MSRADRRRRTWGQRTVLSVNVVAITAALASALVLSEGKTRSEQLERVELEGFLSEPVETESGVASDVTRGAIVARVAGGGPLASPDPEHAVRVAARAKAARRETRTGSAYELPVGATGHSREPGTRHTHPRVSDGA